MAKVIKLKYASRCKECGVELPAGSRARYYGPGRVYGVDCHSRSDSAGGLKYDPYHDPNNWAGDPSRAPFRDPGGRSALRAGARVHPCPTCGRPNALSEADKRLGYQCDRCADAAEGLYPSEY